jgi:pyruvate carboxylase
MNPRIQVEHTVTEVITGLDLVAALRSCIAQGHAHRTADEVGMPVPEPRFGCNGYAIQCRVTTEDPENKFIPDYGTHHSPTARRAASASGSTAAWATPARSSRPSTIRCW